MSKRKATTTSSKSSGQGFVKKASTAPQGSSVVPEQAPVTPVSVPSAPPLSKDEFTGVTFQAVMLQVEMVTLTKVVNEAGDRINHYTSQINEITSRIGHQASLANSGEIVDCIDLVVEVKAAVAGVVSWISVVANVAHHWITRFDEQLPDELIRSIETFLPDIESIFDSVLTGLPGESILGITLAPDQKQISEAKATISDVFSKIEKVKQENKEAGEDWGPVEQKAYERILEGSNRNVSGEEFLNWLSDLEQGHDI